MTARPTTSSDPFFTAGYRLIAPIANVLCLWIWLATYGDRVNDTGWRYLAVAVPVNVVVLTVAGRLRGASWQRIAIALAVDAGVTLAVLVLVLFALLSQMHD